MREINLDRLRTLVTVADRGTFAAAAKVLHLAPPTVTLHVAELESRLGARLLVRGRERATPTGVGQTLIDRARQLLAQADEALEQVRSQVAGRGGRVRIGASTGALAHLLPQALRVLQRDHPAIDLQVAVTTSAEAMARLASGQLDLGLIALPQPPLRGVQLRSWRRDPVRAFVPAAWHAPKLVTPAWLAERPLILNDASTRLARQTADWFARAGLHPQPRIELNYNDAIKSLVAAGYGAALLPHEAGAPAPNAEQIGVHALRPALWRTLGLACRVGSDDGPVRVVLEVLSGFPSGSAQDLSTASPLPRRRPSR